MACFRDDVVFVIFLYQRWIYPVDKTRVNEYGQSFAEDNDDEGTTDGKAKADAAAAADADAANANSNASADDADAEASDAADSDVAETADAAVDTFDDDNEAKKTK